MNKMNYKVLNKYLIKDLIKNCCNFIFKYFEMRKVFIFSALVLLFACNSSVSNESTYNREAAEKDAAVATIPPGAVAPLPTKIVVEGKQIDLGGTLLVQKDKDKLQPGADYLVIFTAPGGATAKSSLLINFLMALKPGSYPIVGMNYKRAGYPYSEIYGEVSGGKAKLTNYKMNITECKDLGDNGQGGHKWSISGNFGELTIPAMEVMLLSKTRNHPKEIKIDSGSFTNLSFDDNWEEIMKKATGQK